MTTPWAVPWPDYGTNTAVVILRSPSSLALLKGRLRDEGPTIHSWSPGHDSRSFALLRMTTSSASRPTLSASRCEERPQRRASRCRARRAFTQSRVRCYARCVLNALHVTTGANGRFRVVAVPPGQYILTVHRVGYVPLAAAVQISPRSCRHQTSWPSKCTRGRPRFRCNTGTATAGAA